MGSHCSVLEAEGDCDKGLVLKSVDDTVRLLFNCNEEEDQNASRRSPYCEKGTKCTKVDCKSSKALKSTSSSSSTNSSVVSEPCTTKPKNNTSILKENEFIYKTKITPHNNIVVVKPVCNESTKNCCEGASWNDAILKNIGTMDDELKKYDTHREHLKKAQQQIKIELKNYNRRKERLEKQLCSTAENLNENKESYEKLVKEFESVSEQLKQYEDCRSEIAAKYDDVRKDLCETEECNNYYTDYLTKLREELDSIEQCRCCLQENNDKILFEITKYEKYRDHMKQIHDKTKEELKQMSDVPQQCEPLKKKQQKECQVDSCGGNNSSGEDVELIRQMIRNEYCKIIKELEKVMKCGYKCPEKAEVPQCQLKKQSVIDCYRDHPDRTIMCQQKVRDYVESVVLAKCINKEKKSC